MRKTWKGKMNPGAKPKLVQLEKPFMGCPAGAQMLVATPEIVRDYIKHIRRGRTKSVAQMREDLAAQFGADTTCPTSSGIFVRINAEAALEDLKNGVSIDKVTPFWRLVDPNSLAAKKLSCGPKFIEQRRSEEAER